MQEAGGSNPLVPTIKRGFNLKPLFLINEHNMIQIENITLMVAGKELLEGASCQIADGQKVGIIGDNGCGKSTLFKAILGQNEPFLGKIETPKNAIIAFAEQEIADTSLPILQFVLSKNKQLTYYREKLLTAEEGELADIHEHLRLLGSDSAEGRVAAILHGLGFKQEDFTRPIHDFSGGWRMRLTLAGALFQNSDILLLDEPSNHLDWEATVWLESYLKKYRGTLLIISHDKSFLNNNCEAILNFEHKKLVLYHGNYQTFQATYALKAENLKRQIQKDEEKRAHLQAFVDRFRYKATKAKQAQSRIKMIEKMGEQLQFAPDKKDVFNFPETDNLPSPYLKLEDVAVGYNNVPVLSKLNMNLVENERIGLLGRNGNGKSTLAKLISGALKPLAGTVFKSPKLRVGYFNQDQNEALPADKTPLEYLTGFMPDKSESYIRTYLAGFGLEAEKAITKIASLSGGEKVRLLLAEICLPKPQLLILDEPTNHLDLKGREALIDAINRYNGSVILITHDFYMLQCVADDLWIVRNGTCKKYDGDLEDYRNFLLNEKTDKNETKPKPEVRQVKEKKMSKSTLQVKIKQTEAALDELYWQQHDIEEQLASGGNIDYAELNKKLAEVNDNISEQEKLWDFYASQI